MNAKKIIIVVSVFLFIMAMGSEITASKNKPEDLPERHRKWLEEEVIYIITPKEKDVFLQLESDRERDLFIEAFWSHRDPTPGSLENEFKKEHYARIAYANKWFGRGTPTVGWRTAMGRIHIILGKPQYEEKYENETEVYPTIVWFYQGMSPFGLPDSFNVVFFKEYGSGDYEIYSPIQDGPQKLLVHYFGDPKDYLSAFNQLKEIRPNLAYTSLTLLPGESWNAVNPSMASEILLSNIYVKPQKAVKDEYAEKLLKYKDFVEVEYTANYIGNDHLVSIHKDESGVYFVHYLIEPEKLSVNFAEPRYYTTLEVSGKVSELSGKTVYQFNKTIPIQFDEEELKKIQTKPFSLQDVFPLVEGSYKFDLLLKNRVSKEFTSVEKNITIPSDQSSAEMTPIILAPQAKNVSSLSSNKPFKLEDTQLYPSARNEFSIHDTLHVFFQIPSLNQELQETGRFQFTIYRGDEEVHKDIKAIKSYPKKGQFLEKFYLKNFPPAYYEVEVKVLSAENATILSESAYFSVAAVEVVPRPFIYAERAPSPTNPVIDYIVGGQYYNKGDQEKAGIFLERAYRKSPQSLQYAEGLSRLYFSQGRFEEVRKILLPFSETPQKNNQFLKLLGQASHKLKQYEDAITHYKQYLTHFGTNLDVLNAIGSCYYSLGNQAEALRAWERSLEINPNQEQIKKIVASIKGEK